MMPNNDNDESVQCNLSLHRCPMCNAENNPTNRPPEYSPPMERRKLSTRNSSPPMERGAVAGGSQSVGEDRRRDKWTTRSTDKESVGVQAHVSWTAK